MTEKKKAILAGIADWLNAVLTVVYFAFVYFVSCLFLNTLIPHLMPTERTAQQFWVYGVAALAFCGGGYALLKLSRHPSLARRHARLIRAMGFAFEGLIFIGAIVILVEAFQYAAWVRQFEPITVHSGTDIRFWVAAILFTDGILGNLLSALLMV